MPAITRHYISVEGRWVHYRRAGTGPALIMLHGSPNSSLTLVPLMEFMADRFTVIALDTPGNGYSEPLIHDAPSTEDYGAALADTLDALGIERCALYGFHTGAGIATAFAGAHPDRVTTLVLDGYAAWTDDEKTGMLTDYLPAFEPKADGSHLAALWSRAMTQTIFFPWHVTTPQTRMIYDMPPPDRLQASVMDFLRADDGYRAPYAAALSGDGVARARRIKGPALISAHDLDPISHHLDRLIGLADGVIVEHTNAAPDDMWARFRDWLSAYPAPPPPPPGSPGHDAQGRTRSFTHGAEVPLFWTGVTRGDNRPLVLLHDAGGSSQLFAPMLTAIGQTRPVIALDLPAHGGSTGGPMQPSVPALADTVQASLHALRVDTYDAIGFHLGGQIAAELIKRGAARHGALIGTPHYTPAERAEFVEHYTPSIAPRWDGSHLMTAWHLVRFQALYHPWYKRDREHVFLHGNLSTQILHRRVVDLLQAGDHYRTAYAAQFAYPLAETLRAAPAVSLMTPAIDPLSTDDAIANLEAVAGRKIDRTQLDHELAHWATPFARFGL